MTIVEEQTDAPGLSPEAHSDEEKDPAHQGKPANKSRSSRFGRWLTRFFFSLSALAVLAVLLIYVLAQRGLEKPLQFKQQKYAINQGDSLQTFLDQLAQNGVITETITPRLFARYQGIAGQLHTGDYRFEDGSSMRDVLHQVTSGKSQITATLTVVEGATFSQFRAQLAGQAGIQQTLAGLSDAEVMQQLFSSDEHPEGWFFPESYQFRSGDSDASILRRAHEMMQSAVAKIWAERDPETRLKTPYEAMIMASIIEKETGLGSERALISGVFNNRLRKGMLLQTDPTVIYGLGKAFDGNLTRKHLRTDNPYNTYTRKGLPPSPICLPGLAALQAAVHPQKTDALYFVAKGGGAHYFSKTLKEHNRAVRKYQLGQ